MGKSYGSGLERSIAANLWDEGARAAAGPTVCLLLTYRRQTERPAGEIVIAIGTDRAARDSERCCIAGDGGIAQPYDGAALRRDAGSIAANDGPIHINGGVVGHNSTSGIVAERRIENVDCRSHIRAESGENIIHQPDVVQDHEIRNPGRRADNDPVVEIVMDGSVDDGRDRIWRAAFDADAALPRFGNVAVLYEQPGARKKLDSPRIRAGAGSGAIDREVAQHDRIRRGSADHDSIGAAREDARYNSATAIDGDGFRDGDRAIAGWVQGVDLTPGGGLRDRTSEGLARSRPAARIHIVADTGNPRTRRLGG